MNPKLLGEADEGEDDEDVQKKIIDIFNFKQRLLSLDMKTKVVQHVPRSKLDNLKTLKTLKTFRHFYTFNLSTRLAGG